MTTTKCAGGAVSRVEPITTEIFRSAYTPIIYEGKDCSVALLDENGDVLGQSLGLPLFLGNLEVCVKLTAALFGWDACKPGDLFYMNDSYMTGTHLNDATIFGPIHWRGRLVGFSATRAHWLDVGAKHPGGSMDSHEIDQEGMRWGPTRIYENGASRDDVIDLLRRNSAGMDRDDHPVVAPAFGCLVVVLADQCSDHVRQFLGKGGTIGR